MRYNICSSFPFEKIIKFHSEKEQEMLDLQDELARTDPNNELVK